MILSRHTWIPGRPDVTPCARVVEVQRTTLSGMSAGERLKLALAVECTCGQGDLSTERTSLPEEEGKGQWTPKDQQSQQQDTTTS